MICATVQACADPAVGIAGKKQRLNDLKNAAMKNGSSSPKVSAEDAAGFLYVREIDEYLNLNSTSPDVLAEAQEKMGMAVQQEPVLSIP